MELKLKDAIPSDELQFGVAWGEVYPNRASLAAVDIAYNDWAEEYKGFDFVDSNSTVYEESRDWIKANGHKYIELG